MGYTDGRVFKDPTLPGLHPQDRGVIYRAAAKVLAAIHSVDIQKANLSDFGKTGNLASSHYYSTYIVHVHVRVRVRVQHGECDTILNVLLINSVSTIVLFWT